MDGLKDQVMRIMSHTGGLYGAFFMQSFFIITGFCSSFNIPFLTYLWKNVKTLMIPALLLILLSEYYKLIIFSHDFNIVPIKNFMSWFVMGGPWFIWAMFWAKIVYWPISRLDLPCRMIAVITLYLLGLASNNLGLTNYQWHQHALLMVPYLFVGEWCKNNMGIVEKWLKPIAIAGAISIVIQNIICQLGFFSLPEHDHAICLSFKNFSVHVINSISGTAFVFWISQIISKTCNLRIVGAFVF